MNAKHPTGNFLVLGSEKNQNHKTQPQPPAETLNHDSRILIIAIGSQGIRDQFPGDPWIHFCTHYFEVYLFFN